MNFFVDLVNWRAKKKIELKIFKILYINNTSTLNRTKKIIIINLIEKKKRRKEQT